MVPFQALLDDCTVRPRDVSGHSVHTGIALSVRLPTGQAGFNGQPPIWMATPDYAQGFKTMLVRLVFAYIAVSATVWLAWGSTPVPPSVGLPMQFGIAALAALVPNLTRSTREWHACEHMACALLEQDLAISMAQLRSMERHSARCGSVRILLILQVVASCALAWAFPGVCTIGIAALAIVAWLAPWCFPGDRTALVAAIPGLVVPLAAQYLLTAPPTDARLCETLRLVRMIRLRATWMRSL